MMKGSPQQGRITALFILLLPLLLPNNNKNVFVESFSFHDNNFVSLKSLKKGNQRQQQHINYSGKPNHRHVNTHTKKNHNLINHGDSNENILRSKSISTSTRLSAVSTVTATAAAATVAFPTVKNVILTCLTPTLLGFYKSEYGVSYGYGTATAATAYLAYRALTTTTTTTTVGSPLAGLAKCHAMAVIFYGIRLNALLLYRELFVPRFRDMRERIEERAMSKGGRWTRTPFILSCAGLYAGLAAPTLITTKLAILTASGVLDVASISGSGVWGKFMMALFHGSIYAAWGGFMLGALGDLTKSFYKAVKGDDYLVTNGIFRFLRHPNYTGEIIAWTANCLAALSATAICLKTTASWKAFAPSLLLSMASLPGIVSVLLAATMNLEQKQRTRYEDNEEYTNWRMKSWVGLSLDLSAGRSETSSPSSKE